MLVRQPAARTRIKFGILSPFALELRILLSWQPNQDISLSGSLNAKPWAARWMQCNVVQGSSMFAWPCSATQAPAAGVLRCLDQSPISAAWFAVGHVRRAEKEGHRVSRGASVHQAADVAAMLPNDLEDP